MKMKMTTTPTIRHHRPAAPRTSGPAPLLRAAALAAACLCALPLAAQAQSHDPFAAWQTAETANFRIHYRAEHRAQAEQVARIAERVYPRITQALQWQPRGGTDVVISNEFDLSNGHSTPLPFNAMTLYLAPPDSGELLDNSRWLELLVTHELVHVVHLDKVRSVPRVLQSIFGRVPWFFPNLYQPLWVMEGLAVQFEGDASQGRGRLHGPLFDAWLRTERERGFIQLNELASDGRALPLSKNYLYGAYFFEWLARTYGASAPQQFVERYSGNIVPRFHTNPYELTGKTMDELWLAFLDDLTRQVDARNAQLRQQPETVGAPVPLPGERRGALFDITSLASLPGGASLAVVDDGLGAAQLLRIERDGSQRRLSTLATSFARVDAAADGRVLVAQPDLCNTYDLAYDIYRLLPDGSLRQLTHCQRLRRAVHAGPGQIAAIRQDAGRTSLLLLDAEGRQQRVLHPGAADLDLIDLAASPDGSQLSLIARVGGDWRLLALDPARPDAAPRLLARLDAPVHSLRHSAAGLEFIAVRDGVPNVWRLAGAGSGTGTGTGQLQRLTHSHSAVTAQGGTAADGSLLVAVLAPGGQALRRLPATTTLQTVAALPAGAGRSGANTATSPWPDTAASAGTGATSPAGTSATGEPGLGAGRGYSALRSIAPRYWLPTLVLNNRGMNQLGASTAGADALGTHQYAASLAWETSQGEAVGAVEYMWNNSQLFALTRDLTPRAWSGEQGKETTTVYDRRTQAQWLGLLPWHRIERRISLGLGAAIDRVEQVRLAPPAATRSSIRQRDEKLAAALVDFDTRGANWWSEGANRGQRTTLLYETYKPFARSGSGDLDGSVLRLDARGYLGIGSGVLAVRHTEVRAHGRTERYQLGGAADPQLQLGIALNQRDLALRGYAGDEPALQGASARVSSIEWRMPLADIDRHTMVPPIGINRLSLNLVADIGGAWDAGQSKPASYYKGVGAELLGEVKLLYTLGVQLRLGVARGLDEPKATQGYLTVGRAF
ncbi:MAG: hypothetical protein RLZZ584_4077 [Pseudomonadota bacterium]